jgi:hypothetical protein
MSEFGNHSTSWDGWANRATGLIYRPCVPYSPASDGVLDSISMYSRAGSGTINIRMALYDASDGTFVGATVELNIGNTDAWNTANADGTINVYASKSYYICCEQSANHYINYNAHASHDAYKFETYGGTWPSPVTWTNNTSYANAAIYATYTPSGNIVYLAGTISGTAALSAASSVERKLSGAVAGNGGMSPTLKVQRTLIAILAGLGSMAGTARVDRKLIAALAGSGGLAGTLTVNTLNALAGVIAASGNVAGALKVIRSMQGAIAAQGTVTGSLRANWALTGGIYGQGTVIGSLSGVAGSTGLTTRILGKSSGSLSMGKCVSRRRIAL